MRPLRPLGGSHLFPIAFVSEAMIFGKHAVGNQGKSSGHGENSLLDKFGRVYIF